MRQDGEVLLRGFSPWCEPTVVEINRLPMRPPLGASATVEQARHRKFMRRLSLDGRWRFRLLDSPDDFNDALLRGATSKLGSAWRYIDRKSVV